MECVICMDTCNNNEMKQLPICNHSFHKSCINQWLNIKQNCPICRASIINNFIGKQKFSKKNYVDCKITINNNNKLNVIYNNLYTLEIDLKQILYIEIDKKHTIIRVNYNSSIIKLLFKIPNAFLFMDYFKNYVKNR